MRSEAAAELTLHLDEHDTRPLPVQLTAQIRELITAGQLSPGDPIPSTRALCTQLGVSRGTVVAAYEQLSAEGYLHSERGSGTRIHPGLQPLPAATQEVRGREASKSLSTLTPGIPDVSTLIDPTWRAAWREAANNTEALPVAGSMALRREIAHHLRHMRGVIAHPEHIIVTSGAREGLMVLLHAMGTRLRVGVESPGYPSLRRVPELLGHQLVEVGTDAHGVREDALQPMDALICTPSHQYPHGGSLPAQRRTAIARWAELNNAWIIEDDFDSELRYEGQPLPALTALAPARTALLGTFSTLVSPTIACGYILVPPSLFDATLRIRTLLSQPAGAITQRALTHYMATGALRRRTQKLRRTYARRRDIVYQELGGLHDAELRPIRGGLHAVILCSRPAGEVVTGCAARSLGVTALDDYWGGAASSENGVVIGFGALEDDALRRALQTLAYELQRGG
ncbi:MocR-like pyridoxine biosynthesis transcription factor PdxR [Corynebacterium gerontici]|uniref:HTH-type transcriptional regulatory protein GabR n=1 Tax=Corynebacterium gerontici TaxID=2079234 RepID=A0A3G6J2V5_9CORY|nr:PLP-dependent aminotransferase family protein [Corynebacterium gerontici]AZA12357.1 HTH-type transcriptional regulatory protein GabR [Corynebacterium gerontici]